ncbi:hypothetical protein CTAYLR_010502 [Chrysophaeum taylorii]|uniref:Uncharacterized protein n=1 Tax=Chrysophaeum taylorii TaxID=2483200 RepID=A0AAD7XMK6_9STRA|nr:hypothetical protein CTAYLR_010502 [Chrysophaeum taylorii]
MTALERLVEKEEVAAKKLGDASATLVTKEYAFSTSKGAVMTLAELFDGRSRLVVSRAGEGLESIIPHLDECDATLVVVGSSSSGLLSVSSRAFDSDFCDTVSVFCKDGDDVYHTQGSVDTVFFTYEFDPAPKAFDFDDTWWAIALPYGL